MRTVLLAAILAATPALAAGTYRLVHAIGNDEKIVADGMTEAECEHRKKEYAAVATALGLYNERRGIGSITCLPESLFDD